MAKTSAAMSHEGRYAPGEALEVSRAEQAMEGDGETPRGTMFVLLLYAGVLVALWGYTYLSLLLRR